MKAFKAYDIRGIYEKDFDRHDVYKIGFFLPRLLNAEDVLVGRDVRESSEEIFTYLTRGIRDSGANAVSIGLCTTPMVYFNTAYHKFKASVMITASHNPKEYNGLKISREKALPVGSDSGLKDLEKLVKQHHGVTVDSANRGRYAEIDGLTPYLEFLKPYMADLSQLNITVDLSNGMACVLAKQVLGETPHYLFDTLDGTFPNHEPNPLEEHNLKAVKEGVLANGSDLGIIFDGDADRVMFIDEQGKFIQPDLITAVMGNFFLKSGPAKVLQDIRTSRSVTEYLEALGAEVHTGKVGHSFAKRKMRDIGALYGGELAGHYYFRDFFNCDSAMLAALVVLNTAAELKQQGRTVSSLIGEIVKYAASGEINFRIEDKQEAMDTLKEHFSLQEEPTKFMDFDGYRVEFTDWWFNVRPSNTEPYLRLVVEAKSEAMLQEKLETMHKLLEPFQ